MSLCHQPPALTAGSTSRPKGTWSPASAIESGRFRDPILPRLWGLPQTQDITLALLITQRKVLITSSQGVKIKVHFFSKYVSLVQGCCWLWPLAREKLLGWGLGRSPGLKTVSLGLQPRGTRGRGGSWQWARPPLEIWACFLILSFLRWPDQAARRGRGSSGWDQGTEQSKS